MEDARSSTRPTALILRLVGEGKRHRAAHRPPRRALRARRVLRAAAGGRPDRYRAAAGAGGRRRRGRMALAARPHPRAAGPPAWSRPLWVVAEKILARRRAAARRLGGRRHHRLRLPRPRSTASSSTAADARRDDRDLRAVHRRRALDFAELVYAAKRLIMQASMASEINVLATRSTASRERNRRSRDFTLNEPARARSREVIACLPGLPHLRRPTERRARTRATARYIEPRSSRAPSGATPTVNVAIFDFVRDILLLRYPDRAADRGRAAPSGALRDALPADHRAGHGQGRGGHRLLRLQPAGLAQRGGRRARALRRARRRLPRAQRAARSSAGRQSLLATVHPRHQAQRGRARAHQRALRDARRLGRRGPALARDRAPLQARGRRSRRARPQRRVPALPDPGRRLAARTGRDAGGVSRLRRPTWTRRRKEAKGTRAGSNPNAAYDEARPRLRRARPARAGRSRSSPTFRPFQRLGRPRTGRSTRWPRRCSSSPSPGVPDFYQGTELWDLSLVDPDNRRPVDFPRRQALLEPCAPASRPTRPRGPTPRGSAAELLARWPDGRVKLYLTHRALDPAAGARARSSRVGGYRALGADGAGADHVLALARARRHRRGGRGSAAPHRAARRASPAASRSVPPRGRSTVVVARRGSRRRVPRPLHRASP